IVETSEDNLSAYLHKPRITDGPWLVARDGCRRSFVVGESGLPMAEGGSEPIGNRIVELPEDPARVELRDPHSGFISYAPTGALARGKDLVTTGGGKTIACAICHGANLRGLGDVPGIAGRSALNIARQLYYFQTGERGGPSAALMKAPVEKLDGTDVLALSA